MRAQDVGWSDNKIVLGKHSGRSALKSRLEEIGIHIEGEEALNAAFSRFKDVADRKHEIFDEDLIAIANESQVAIDSTRYHLVSSWVCSETGETPHAKVTLKVDGEEVSAEADGGGSVDAVFSAIKNIVEDHGTLELYSVNAITSGTDAQGEVSVKLEKAGRQVYGSGSDPDIVIASANAYLDALNKLALASDREHPQDHEQSHHKGV
jgi:2-isopropylmalate synthase